MFFLSGPLDILILAVAISIVIKPIARAAGEFARARAGREDQDRKLDRGRDVESRERIEALEERLRLVEERQDFTEKLVSGRRDEPRLPPAEGPASDPADVASGAPPRGGPAAAGA